MAFTKFFRCTKFKIETLCNSGNLLTLSCGSVTGWAIINFNELQNKNSTYSAAPLSLQEASFVTSIVGVGGLIGNFAIVPIGQWIGIKRTIHLLGVPLIVRMANLYFSHKYKTNK